MDIREINCKDEKQIKLAQNKVQWQGLVNMVIKVSYTDLRKACDLIAREVLLTF
jgi:hypothetical protein